MNALLADINIQGQMDDLMDLIKSSEWGEFWDDLNLDYIRFKDIGLDTESTDAYVWLLCQTSGYVLITDNRNMESDDSLEETIRRKNRPESLPVFTIADAKRFNDSRSYRRRVAESLIESLMDIERYRGTGRKFLP